MLNSLKYNLQTNLQLERHIVPWRFPVFPKNPKKSSSHGASARAETRCLPRILAALPLSSAPQGGQW